MYPRTVRQVGFRVRQVGALVPVNAWLRPRNQPGSNTRRVPPITSVSIRRCARAVSEKCIKSMIFGVISPVPSNIAMR